MYFLIIIPLPPLYCSVGKKKSTYSNKAAKDNSLWLKIAYSILTQEGICSKQSNKTILAFFVPESWKYILIRGTKMLLCLKEIFS